MNVMGMIARKGGSRTTEIQLALGMKRKEVHDEVKRLERQGYEITCIGRGTQAERLLISVYNEKEIR